MKKSYFFLLKTDHFWSFHAFPKKWKQTEKFLDNLRQSISRIFQLLAVSFHRKWNGTKLSSSGSGCTSCQDVFEKVET